MDKPIVNMSNWILYLYKGEYSLSGTADYHPHIGRNAYVSYTSPLIEHSFNNDVLKYETENTVYVCPLKYMAVAPYRHLAKDALIEHMHLVADPDNILDKIVVASAQMSVIAIKQEYRDTSPDDPWYPKKIMELEEDYADDPWLKKLLSLQISGQKELGEMQDKEENRLIELACRYEDCIYLEVSNIESGDLLSYHLGDYTGVIKPYLHVGTFQDSVLYMKYAETDDPCSLDFRYFPRNGIETYSWSDNIKLAVIKNTLDKEITFNDEKIQPGETKVFTTKNHHEGLFSPDCYNGKSVVSAWLKKHNSADG